MFKHKNIFRHYALICSIIVVITFSPDSIAKPSVINTIVFIGNDTTQESVILREMYISVGDIVDYNKIEKSIQGIMDLGLFKTVTYFIQENSSVTDSTELNTELVITVDEKIYFLIIPRIKLRNNQLGIGIQLKWDNVFGLNHRFKWLVEKKGETENIKEFRNRLNYNYTNILGSNYSLNLYLVNENTVDQQTDLSYRNRIDDVLEVRLFKWLNNTSKARGKYVSIGAGTRYRTHETLTGNFIDDATVNFIAFTLGSKKIHSFAYNREGKHYGYDMEISDSAIGSDSNYIKNLVFYRSYYTFDSRPGENLNIQAQIGYSTDDVLGDKAFKLDYRNDLRGYEKDSLQGNSMLLLNIEYMMAFDNYPTLRYLGFIDIGNTYDSFGDVKNDLFKTGLGMGIRWKVDFFVNVDLRFDIGYGLDDENYQFTFGTRHAF